MIRFATAAALAFVAAPAFAQETKEESCALQSQVVAAVQQARLDRVKEREVQDHILAQSPTWPEKYNNTIPLIAPWVYEQPRKIIRNESLADAWSELCLQQ
ncbi:hypothetical protein KUV51_00885 [Tateyamaria omphalii]|uniref:hypothetical protein n=1 Tax=Tateyamaria omphalii TaxID=299262 RepID=UPI001C9A2255|nr:hypothetical protein [Tateyamaria omphalii]MBY5931536.1 hypothetical protein [Tateyamaria omphalii]